MQARMESLVELAQQDRAALAARTESGERKEKTALRANQEFPGKMANEDYGVSLESGERQERREIKARPGRQGGMADQELRGAKVTEVILGHKVLRGSPENQVLWIL